MWQVESETADSEFKLNNATQRLHRLEKDVALLKEKAHNTTSTAEKTEKDMDDINKVAEQVKKVRALVHTFFFWFVWMKSIQCIDNFLGAVKLSSALPYACS